PRSKSAPRVPPRSTRPKPVRSSKDLHRRRAFVEHVHPAGTIDAKRQWIKTLRQRDRGNWLVSPRRKDDNGGLAENRGLVEHVEVTKRVKCDVDRFANCSRRS